MIKKLYLSSGEPAGIGPDIIIKSAQNNWNADLIVIGARNLLLERADLLKLPLTLLPHDHPGIHIPQTLKCFHIDLKEPVEAGQLDYHNATYVIECLETAAKCAYQATGALVTAPIQKSILNDANIFFTGHTEFLANYFNCQQSLMLFVTPKMKVALATTHLPLAAVSSKLTEELIISLIKLLHEKLISQFGCTDPTILVCGLNPHAGEGGHLGKEEINIIQPALKKLRSEKINVSGPFAADTIFTPAYLSRADAIFAMYHDQALPVIKFSAFEEAVNVTLGLPIVRTSVDHGTALELAGTGQANDSSMKAAIRLAIEML